MGKTIDSPDYRSCGCPWGKPFDRWPHHLMAKLKSAVAGGPHKGS